ncbi:glycosyltransferase [Leptolyngbya sp. 7M]|uniref:glycosyltransferase n=1 Tax=Leptolyngbya sp. 7M TaxID=2812896 RepID=UPI001B8C86E9|nr:glycosyltransferase [Leptolyngbya sp. 7M]QYO64687.1 hypothetical protein JVX88_34590 [Leptolyngbya sp. 7M]
MQPEVSVIITAYNTAAYIEKAIKMDHMLTRFQSAADIPYAFSYGQMPAAQAVALRALFGKSQAEPASGREFTD